MGGAEAESEAAAASADETMSLTSLSEVGDAPPNGAADGEDADAAANRRDDDGDDGGGDKSDKGDAPAAEAPACPKWSTALSTPRGGAAFTPSADVSTSPKLNLHGLGLRLCVDRTKALARTGKGRAALLLEVASLHDELVREFRRLCPPALEAAAAGTPMEGFARDVSRCLSSFASQTASLGTSVRDDVARPCAENAQRLLEEGARRYGSYVAARGRCAAARRDALRLRRRYLDGAKEVEGAIASLRKARVARRRKRKNADPSNGNGNSNGNNGNDGRNDPHEDGKEVVAEGGGESPSPPSWESDLRAFGDRLSLSPKCEAVIRAADEETALRAKYSVAVAEENAAVDDARDVEEAALDGLRALEEERIVFLVGLLDRFLQDVKESLENMTLDLASVDPLDMADGKSTLSSVPTTTTTPTPSSIFLSPRRRAQSDDGPAINETRLLNLPDKIAEIRDHMKSLVGRQHGRLKALKQVAAFNEGLALAIESFAEGLKFLLGSSPSTVVLEKNEGANVLGSWNAAVGSLAAYANCATVLAKQIREGNLLVQLKVQSAEKETKAFQEKEEYRWKALCDAARVEAKAKSKHSQYVADLEKARARLTVVEGEEDEDEEGTAGDGDNSNGSGGANLSPLKSTTIDRQLNKAGAWITKKNQENLGKMFSILPGGGEDVMNKVLTAQQRQGIVNRQLDEALAKEEKGAESFEVARSVRQQASVSYETKAEASEFKFKSDERSEWNEMQKSLVSCVAATRVFRKEYLEIVSSSIVTVRERHLGSKALDDVAQWTASAEGRLKDKWALSADESKEEENHSSENGYSLRVQLVETNVKDLVLSFLDEKDVIVEDPNDIGNGEDSGAESPSKDANKRDSTVVTKETPSPTPTPLPDVPIDPWIKKMDGIFSKKLQNVSIDKYYNIGWLEEDTPLYGPWLERKGSFDVSVTDWERAEDGDGFVNVWSKEKFTQRRTIKFKFKRTSHLYIGPPIAGVTQTQYLMKDGNDRCVVMMTVEMDGIPYSDVFAVEVRWSARRVEQTNIAIDAGVFVRFTKSSMFASKIKSGTLKETSPIHLDLFEVIKTALASGEEGGEVEDADIEPKEEMEIATAETEQEANVTTLDTTTSQVESKFDQLIAAFSSLTQNQQLLLAFVIFYFVTKMIFPKKDITADKVNDLAQKVDGLANEVKEMKAMLESLLKISEQSLTRGASCNGYSTEEAFAQEL